MAETTTKSDSDTRREEVKELFRSGKLSEDETAKRLATIKNDKAPVRHRTYELLECGTGKGIKDMGSGPDGKGSVVKTGK